jgi:pimeloyl-ACP methyl ester carboxylesterase
MRMLHVAGTALLRRPGPGAALVLLHGIGGGAESWTRVVPLLPADLDVIAWWAPGYGQSVPLAEEAPTPEDYATRLAAVLDALGLDRVALAGQSLGGLFAGRFAAGRPHRVRSVAFLAAALGYGVAADRPMPAGVQARLDDLRALGGEAFAARRAARLLHDAARKPAQLEAVTRTMAAVKLPGYAQACRALSAGDLLADAGRLARPALVMVGAEDPIAPPDTARALHAALPAGSALELIPDVGHALPEETPERVAAALAAQLR